MPHARLRGCLFAKAPHVAAQCPERIDTTVSSHGATELGYASIGKDSYEDQGIDTDEHGAYGGNGTCVVYGEQRGTGSLARKEQQKYSNDEHERTGTYSGHACAVQAITIDPRVDQDAVWRVRPIGNGIIVASSSGISRTTLTVRFVDDATRESRTRLDELQVDTDATVIGRGLMAKNSPRDPQWYHVKNAAIAVWLVGV